MSRRLLVGLAVALSTVLAPAAAPAADPTPFGNPCTPQLGVRFCPAADLTQRVPSWDKVPMDVDVTLPATGDGPFPTIVMMHGYGGNKGAYEAKTQSTGFNNVGLASRGYAVVTLSARGFGKSCGSAASRTAGCERGWIHLADQRYEAHDTQYLLGLLVDQKIASPKALGVTGGSYGGGQSLNLAYLKNRVRKVNGAFVPWTSPKGTKLSIAAAYPVIPWSDLSSALVPNGRAANFGTPPGVQIQSYVNALYNGGNATGFVSPLGADASADLQSWNDLTNKGEPYGASAKAALATLSKYHSVMQLKGTPAPLLMASGWTDDLFPPVQTTRVYDALRKKNRKAPVWLQVGDFGHARGGSHINDQMALNTQAVAFFDHYLRGRKTALPKPGAVLAFGQTCPSNAPSGLGPFRASSWSGLTKKSVTLSAPGTQTVTHDGGDMALSKSLDPILGKGANACSTYPSTGVTAGTALATTTSKGFTYLGVGHITAKVSTAGLYGQLDARLWDVDGETQTLVDRSVYRLTPGQKGNVAFDLHGNGYAFPAGHTVKLELLGYDAPTHRASNGTFTVQVSKTKAVLPTR